MKNVLNPYIIFIALCALIGFGLTHTLWGAIQGASVGLSIIIIGEFYVLVLQLREKNQKLQDLVDERDKRIENLIQRLNQQENLVQKLKQKF